MKNLLRNVAYASVIIAAATFTVHNLNGSAEAQIPPGTIVGYSTDAGGDVHLVMLSNGDIYLRRKAFDTWPPTFTGAPPASYVGNFFDSQPIPANGNTWGSIKSGLKKK